MTMRCKFPLVTTLVVGLSLCGRAEAQSVMLKAKHKAGETTYVEQHTEVSQHIKGGPMPGEGMEIGVDRVYGLVRKIESASDDGAKISMTFDRAMQKIESPMMEASFDSDLPEDDDTPPMVAAPLKAMIGGSFKMAVDNDGHVKDFSGMKAILDKVEEASPGNPFMMQLRAELSDERGRETYGEMMFLMYPNKEVKVGDSWEKTHRDTLPQIGKVISHYKYRLDRLSEESGRKVAVVAYSSEMKKDDSGKPSEMHGMNAEVDGKTTGTMTYDIERGTVVKASSDGKMNIEMRQDAPKAKKGDDKGGKKDGDDDADEDDEPAKPMKIDIKIKQTITVMSEGERAGQKEAAAKKAKAAPKKAEPAKDKKKDAKKPAKSDDDDDDDE